MKKRLVGSGYRLEDNDALAWCKDQRSRLTMTIPAVSAKSEVRKEHRYSLIWRNVERREIRPPLAPAKDVYFPIHYVGGRSPSSRWHISLPRPCVCCRIVNLNGASNRCTPPQTPPMTYIFPSTVTAAGNVLAVGIPVFLVHVFVVGSYASTFAYATSLAAPPFPPTT